MDTEECGMTAEQQINPEILAEAKFIAYGESARTLRRAIDLNVFPSDHRALERALKKDRWLFEHIESDDLFAAGHANWPNQYDRSDASFS